ncbi:bifunctional DNA primase/helicase [Parashewanella curva]|uniref:Bifunctional DNA primase/helicase n=1 Tax=Parashewanella curva TaxID=2338552 RepID=A0A3L8PVM0_9GAMM|nr:toprim domain-containing protein [Parashewanella curva]RLV59465.1 bifunctional DNA primase/helicase [Parashewanella curva]
MYPELYQEVLRRLPRDFDFKKQSTDFLQQGICPNCGKRELYTSKNEPWLLRCGRLNKCGHELHIKQLYPDLFNSWSERFPVNDENHGSTDTANAYLKYGRGFTLNLIKGWYQQGFYTDKTTGFSSSTVKFTLTNGTTWERLIDKPDRFGSKKAVFKGKYQGEWWQAPNFCVDTLPQELWLTEGIFDAIALLHSGLTAVSTMSCNNFPEKALQHLEVLLAGKPKPTLVFAFDTGNAGESFTQKFVDRARKLGWQATAAQPYTAKIKLDWNELLLREKLTAEHLEHYRHLGKLLVARSAMDKALLIYQKQSYTEFTFDFNCSLYWFTIDVKNCRKVEEQLSDNDSNKSNQAEKKAQAMRESSKIKMLAKCFPKALYSYQINDTKEVRYAFRIDFPHQNYSIKTTFSGCQLSSSYEFKRRLLTVASGAIFRGNTHQLDHLVEKQLYDIKQVQALDYMGYSVEHESYIFNDIAVKKGRIYHLNEDEYFDIPPLTVKSIYSLQLNINTDLEQFNSDCFNKLWQAFGAKAFVTLVFWFGSLFAEQIRKLQKTYCFFELSGEPGGGKTTLIEFLWKCCGRSDYEGFDPNNATPSGRARTLAQVGNLPLVISEAERDPAKDSKFARFDWEEFKMLYNGRPTCTRGIKSNDNETRNPKFRGAILIEQNFDVQADKAILQRIVKLSVDSKSQTAESLEAAEWLESAEIEQVSGFMLKAILNEDQVLSIVKERMPLHRKRLKQECNIRSNRIAKNHAQLCSLMEAMAIIFQLPQWQVEETQQLLEAIAKERQQATSRDHPQLQLFWDVYEFLESEQVNSVNHARDPQLIAINLNQFAEAAAARKQHIPLLSELKRLLKISRIHSFIGQKTVNSAVNHRLNQSFPTMKKSNCVKCWVFQRGDLL